MGICCCSGSDHTQYENDIIAKIQAKNAPVSSQEHGQEHKNSVANEEDHHTS